MLIRAFIFLTLEQVGVCAGVEHQQGETRVVLLPYKQPVRLDVALPRHPILEARQLVRTVLLRQGAFYAENINQVCNLVYVKSALDASFDGTLELRGVINRVHRSIG